MVAVVIHGLNAYRLYRLRLIKRGALVKIKEGNENAGQWAIVTRTSRFFHTDEARITLTNGRINVRPNHRIQKSALEVVSANR